jgi:sugar transferase EpsL
MKRVFDAVVAGAALVLLAPVLAVVAVAVRVSMGTPVLFRQTRAGRNAEPFALYKFRTMREAQPGEEGPEFDSQRLGRLGRALRSTSIDELPSLWNVVRGDLSLVGPRPLPASYVERYTDEQRRRLEVRPGLTGWAVVHGRNLLSWDERLALDVWYVDHRSWRVDLAVLWRSVGLVTRRVGVDHADGVTMTELPVRRDGGREG